MRSVWGVLGLGWAGCKALHRLLTRRRRDRAADLDYRSGLGRRPEDQSPP